MRRLPLALAALTCLLASTASAACPTEATERVFAHPYGEPPPPCTDEAPDPPRALDSDLRDRAFWEVREERRLLTMGIAGLASGGALAAIGGTSVLISRFVPETSEGRAILHWGGIGLAVAGGALFLAGMTMVGIDALAAPTPTPDGRGAQLTLAFSF